MAQPQPPSHQCRPRPFRQVLQAAKEEGETQWRTPARDTAAHVPGWLSGGLRGKLRSPNASPGFSYTTLFMFVCGFPKITELLC